MLFSRWSCCCRCRYRRWSLLLMEVMIMMICCHCYSGLVLLFSRVVIYCAVLTLLIIIMWISVPMFSFAWFYNCMPSLSTAGCDGYSGVQELLRTPGGQLRGGPAHHPPPPPPPPRLQDRVLQGSLHTRAGGAAGYWSDGRGAGLPQTEWKGRSCGSSLPPRESTLHGFPPGTDWRPKMASLLSAHGIVRSLGLSKADLKRENEIVVD